MNTSSARALILFFASEIGIMALARAGFSVENLRRSEFSGVQDHE
jgi:hypothetical protein